MVALMLSASHLLLTLIAFILIKKRVISAEPGATVILLFVPFWGFVSILLTGTLFRRAEARELENEGFNIEGSIYQKITVAQQETNVVPLEEAILISGKTIRRSMMMDLLKQDQRQYAELLQRATENDDMEVSHYATTSMMELQQEYEHKIQLYERRLKASSDDIESLEQLLAIMAEYLKSGLISGSVREIYLLRYKELLEQAILVFPEQSDYYHKKAVVELEQGHLQEAGAVVAELMERWPDEEASVLLKLRYLAEAGKGQEIQIFIRELQKRNVYLSSSGRAVLKFWEEAK